MAGYAVTSRIEAVAPRARIDRPAAAGASATDLPVAAVTIDLVGGRPVRAGSERMEALRERWAQATFFLFDANSWR